MSLPDAVRSCLQKYVTFSGRARRSEYWYFTLAVVIGFVVAEIIDAVIRIQIFTFIVLLAVILPSLAVCWRRLHDTGRSGGWYFISLIPIVGPIILLVFTVQDSQPGDNQYGPNPKGVAPGTVATS